MSELCSSIIEREGEGFLSGKEIISRCRAEVLKACGIDISAVLQEQVRLGTTVKQILDEVRSLNGSLCLKYSFGLSPWKLGVPHRITIRAESKGCGGTNKKGFYYLTAMLPASLCSSH